MFSERSWTSSMIVQADGKIVVAGNLAGTDGAGSGAALVRVSMEIAHRPGLMSAAWVSNGKHVAHMRRES